MPMDAVPRTRPDRLGHSSARVVGVEPKSEGLSENDSPDGRPSETQKPQVPLSVVHLSRGADAEVRPVPDRDDDPEAGGQVPRLQVGDGRAPDL